MDIRFCMLLKGLDPVENAHPPSVFYWNRGITTAIYDPHSIPVCLSTVHHKSLELGLRDTMLCHNNIQVLPKYTLNSSIL
jgi:hypothetical protein